MLLRETHGAVCTLTLNRPDVRNAFNPELIRALTQAFQEIDTDRAIRVVHLLGSGKVFSAGADLAWMQSMAHASVDDNRRDAETLGFLFEVMNVCTKPIVCQVHGAAMGGGIGLVAVSDIVIAERQTIFAFSEVKLGLIPAVISPYVATKMGVSAMKRYFLTAEPFSAEEAKQQGLVHEIVDGNPSARAQAFIEIVLDNSPMAIAGAKRLIRKVGQDFSQDLLNETYRAIADHRSSGEGKEGMAAFLEKRKPNWAERNST